MSVTQTVRRPVVNQSRTHDYLYDPLYTLSSERDHGRQAFKAHTNADRIKRVPVHNTMFSALQHHPRFEMRLESTDPVPRFINRQWRGYGEQARQALIRYKTFNYAPDIPLPSRHFRDAEVAGRNRYKFFRRPLIPFMQQWLQPDVVLQSSNIDPLGQQDAAIQERVPTPPFRTVEIQTDYRESETQTDPYTPEYVVRPGSQPELLTLATLSFGHGLPAGLAEVEMIERARAKREWEATLPPLSDASQLEKRKRMMDEMERKEWALREQEIEKLQEARLKLLQKILKEREEHHAEITSKRLDKIWSKKQKEREKKVAWIRKEHIKAIRKLTAKRRTVEGKLERRDITTDYATYQSEAYAPLTRHGVFMDKGSEQFAVKSKYLSTYRGLMELENSLPDFVMQPRVVAPKPKVVSKEGFVKRAQRKQNELDEVYRDIKLMKNKGKEKEKPLRLLQKIEKPIPRPPTPSVEIPDQVEEERELAVIFLQQVIRGRAIQNMMYEGKEKRQELINELRSTHALQEAEQQLLKQEKQATLNLQRQRKLHTHKESFVDEALSKLEGGALGDTLDFLSKELIRLQEERRIHAFAMLAERKRRIREAEESGRRQVEERRRREEDEIFKQVVKVHQNSVDTYLEDMILMSMDMTADNQAREEVQILAEQINDIAYEMEDKKTALQSEEIVAELVSSFLLPEVQKQTVREKVKYSQRKHLLAAHKVIHKEAEEVISNHPQPLNPVRPQKSPAEESTNNNNNNKDVEEPDSNLKTSKPPTPTKASSSPVTSRPPSGSGSRKDSPLLEKGRRGSAKVRSRPSSRPGSAAKSGSRPGSAKSGKTSPKQLDTTTGSDVNVENETEATGEGVKEDSNLEEGVTVTDGVDKSDEVKSDTAAVKSELMEDKAIVFEVNKDDKNDEKDSVVPVVSEELPKEESSEDKTQEDGEKVVVGADAPENGEVPPESRVVPPESGEDVGRDEVPLERSKVDSATQDGSESKPERMESATQEG